MPQLPTRESLLATADEAEARAAATIVRAEREAASLREFAAELRKAAEKAPRGLPDVNMPGKVNTSMFAEHRVAISRGRDAKDAFLMAIRAKGYTLRSLAKKLDVPPSLLSMHRASKASGNGRPIPRARAERIEKLTDWPADLAHWPHGIA